jgi:hypothetical protein
MAAIRFRLISLVVLPSGEDGHDDLTALARWLRHVCGTDATPIYCQVWPGTGQVSQDPLLAKYVHLVGYRRWPGTQPLSCLRRPAAAGPRCGQV